MINMGILADKYKSFLEENPNTDLTFVQWLKTIEFNIDNNFEPIVSDDFQIGTNGAFEYDEDEMKDWDITLMDGLDDDDWDD